jgi:hypothetical protein
VDCCTVEQKRAKDRRNPAAAGPDGPPAELDQHELVSGPAAEVRGLRAQQCRRGLGPLAEVGRREVALVEVWEHGRADDAGRAPMPADIHLGLLPDPQPKAAHDGPAQHDLVAGPRLTSVEQGRGEQRAPAGGQADGGHDHAIDSDDTVVPERPAGNPGRPAEPGLGLPGRHELELQVDSGIPGPAVQPGSGHEHQQAGAERNGRGDRQDRQHGAGQRGPDRHA